MPKGTSPLVLATVLVLIATASPAHAFRKDRALRDRYALSAEQQNDRLRRIMLPLLRVADHRMPLDDIRISIVDSPELNAANAGDGRYYVTTALLNQATDDELRGVFAHEIAHEDLGHPARAQIVSTGVGLGVALLEQLFPGSSTVTPLAGSLITNGYTRPMELEADRHAVILLERAGYSKQVMVDTLAWLMRRNGDSGGGILSSHPATSERIQALHALR